MKKVLSIVSLCAFMSVAAMADDSLLESRSELSTKGLVRMSLWYQGVDTAEELTQNQQVKESKITEELERALLDV